MTVNSIRYQPIEGGALGGHFALHVTLGEGNLPGVDSTPTEVSTRIHDAFKSLDLKSKSISGVLFDCRKAILAPEEMISLLGTMRDWKYPIILWVGEMTRHPWFEYANFITVFVVSTNWPNFRANEIRYVPPINGDEWTEPEVFEVNQGAVCYVDPFSDRKNKSVATQLLQFITEAKRAWGVIPFAHVPAAIDFGLTSKPEDSSEEST